jgi:2-polyprenyl-6-methoxyphenol hydroxylase-like FAD-dependent oxidoreductase
VIQVRTQEVFERMGIIAEILAGAQPMLRMNVMGRERPLVSVGINRLPGRFPAPVVLEQSATEAVLEARLNHLGGHVERNTKLIAYRETADGVTVTLATADGETTVLAAWLLGCDGVHSAVRHLAGIPFEGSQYQDTFDQADLQLRWDRPRGEGYFFFRPHGGLVACLPLPRDRYRVLCLGGEHPTHDPTLADFQRMVDEVAPGTELHDPEWLVRFRLHLRVVPRMRQGHALLAGDAAHVHSPAGGQGMNTGIQDAFNLAWKLALVRRGAAEPDLLDSYDRERQIAARQVMRFSDAAFRRATAGGRSAAWLRTLLIRTVLPLLANTTAAASTISQTRISYRSAGTGLDARRWPRRGPGPGDRAPDASLTCPDGQIALFTRLAAAPGFALVRLPGSRPDAALDEAAAAVVARWPGIVDSFEVRSGTAADGLTDPHGQLYREYSVRGPELLLIRPDGHIAARAPLTRAGAITTCLETLLRTGRVTTA